MTPDQISALLAKRDKIAVRYAYRTNQLDQIDRKLRKIPAGTDNRVDLALGRPRAVLPQRVDYGLTAQAEQFRAMSAGQPDGIVEHDDVLEGAW